MDASAAPLLTDLLKAVSRSFYLTLRVLPSEVRGPIGTAYLLARLTDTIADTELVPVPRRLEALQALCARIQGSEQQPVAFGDLAAAQPATPGGGTQAERVLLERVDEVLALLAKLPAADQALVRAVLATITSGQELDLRRFGAANPSAIVALSSPEELNDYTYRVAGCVGEFWTKICRCHLFPNEPLDEAMLLHNAVRFGQGLQLVNILRDLPRDLRQGRCYLPRALLSGAGLRPEDLLRPESFARLRPTYVGLLDEAEQHLAAGWRYTLALPRRLMRVRLACAWPILIGVRTLSALRETNALDPSQRVKVNRSEVRKILFATVLRYPSERSWCALFEEFRASGSSHAG
jgi:farnesyl-diphosphate farnesyltransferase